MATHWYCTCFYSPFSKYGKYHYQDQHHCMRVHLPMPSKSLFAPRLSPVSYRAFHHKNGRRIFAAPLASSLISKCYCRIIDILFSKYNPDHLTGFRIKHRAHCRPKKHINSPGCCNPFMHFIRPAILYFWVKPIPGLYCKPYTTDFW